MCLSHRKLDGHLRSRCGRCVLGRFLFALLCSFLFSLGDDVELFGVGVFEDLFEGAGFTFLVLDAVSVEEMVPSGVHDVA